MNLEARETDERLEPCRQPQVNISETDLVDDTCQFDFARNAVYRQLDITGRNILNTSVHRIEQSTIGGKLGLATAGQTMPCHQFVKADIPATTVAPSNPYRDEILMALGAKEFQGLFNFTDAMSLVIFDAGPVTQDATLLITNLLAAGYPAEKIGYYRGGMLVWSTSGLSTDAVSQ